jgi:mRNA interferase RelE/StbE
LVWQIEYSASAKRELKRLDKSIAKRIIDYMDSQVGNLDDAKQLGKALTGDLGAYWRYRVGDYRILCEIHDKEITVLVLGVGHRRDVYKR